ncbi:hypothetical protein Ga0074812_10417 [Parafrankia irregularis]|uniref:Uncharacterized protein n=1 Tax=Parafrankia irregularis TaxID=795642 RepID=A0A0S4QJE1_9ACTN|nr:hypothetical protein Ga0074812_10417 [Parafrankia irregularis]
MADAPVLDLAEAVDRVAAAAEAARALPFDFVLTARSENFLYGRPDLADPSAGQMVGAMGDWVLSRAPAGRRAYQARRRRAGS